MSKPTVNHFRCLGITLSVRIMDLFAACRNRETTEPGVFMLPASWRFLKLFLYASWQPSLAHAFFRGQRRKRKIWGAGGLEKMQGGPWVSSPTRPQSLQASTFLFKKKRCLRYIHFYLADEDGFGPEPRRVCVWVFMNVFFLWTWKMFSMQVSPAVIFVKLKPQLLWHSGLTVLPKASVGSELCFTGTCQTAESGGSLESLLIKTETSQTDIPQHPLGCQSRFGYAQNFKK